MRLYSRHACIFGPGGVFLKPFDLTNREAPIGADRQDLVNAVAVAGGAWFGRVGPLALPRRQCA
jgi:hypothetical protein